MMYEKYRTQIQEAVDAQKGTVLREVIPVDKLPDWIHFLNHMTYAAKDSDPEHINKGFAEQGRKIIGTIHFWGEFNLVSSKLQDFYPHKDLYKSVFHEIYGGELTDLTSVLSVTDWDPSSTRHFDGADVLNLQCLGQTKWQVCEAYEGPCEEFVLNPGDVMFVPARLYHEVSAIGPRANIIFGYDPKRPLFE